MNSPCLVEVVTALHPWLRMLVRLGVQPLFPVTVECKRAHSVALQGHSKRMPCVSFATNLCVDVHSPPVLPLAVAGSHSAQRHSDRACMAETRAMRASVLCGRCPPPPCAFAKNMRTAAAPKMHSLGARSICRHVYKPFPYTCRHILRACVPCRSMLQRALSRPCPASPVRNPYTRHRTLSSLTTQAASW